MTSLEKELNAHKIIKNRYGLVVFGGNDMWHRPQVRTVHGSDFVSAKDVDNMLHDLQPG